MSDMRELALNSNAWPFVEARKVLARVENKPPQKGYVLFETGYGPSGLPHIGTFQEVLRTSLVRRAYEALTGEQTRLVAFSDDMDGLRKVPDNVPNKELLEANLGKPLSRIPSPFSNEHESFAAHNNAKLREFFGIVETLAVHKVHRQNCVTAQFAEDCRDCQRGIVSEEPLEFFLEPKSST